MGILAFIFGKPIKIENHFFGEMRFMEIKQNPSESYFECRRHFQPSNDSIEIGLDGDITGPTQAQIDFFRSVESRYIEISNSATSLLEERLRNWKENFSIIDFSQEFTPVYLTIPRCEISPLIWEIAFDSIHDKSHTFSLTMEEFRATRLVVDG